MKFNFLISFAFLLFIGYTGVAQNELSFKITVAPVHKNILKPDGRLFLYFSQSEKGEPRYDAGTGRGSYVFARNVEKWNGGKALEVHGKDQWVKTGDWDLANVPEGEYYVQAVWRQSGDMESRIN